MNEELSHLELWMPEIKKYIRKNSGAILEGRGFTYHKSAFSFKRKHRKNYEELSFVFVNHFPISYRINFLLQIWNNEVRMVKEAYPDKEKIENFKLRSLVFFMRDFMAEPVSDTGFQQVNYDFKILTNKDLFVAADTISGLLVEQVIPLCDQVTDIAGLDRFFAERPGWTVNSLNLNNMMTELAAARLNRKRDFYGVVGSMIDAVEKKITAMEMDRDVRNAVEGFSEFLIKSV
jgi:hypothetical protein